MISEKILIYNEFVIDENGALWSEDQELEVFIEVDCTWQGYINNIVNVAETNY